MGTPRLVVVSGPAGTGKTTLAHALAREIGCPALSRDELKEGMVASHPGFVPGPDDPLTWRTYALFFATIESFLAAEVTLVVEAAFQHRLWAAGLEPLGADLRLVRCHADPALTARRMTDRLTRQASRAAHADAQHLAAAAPFDPVHLDVPTLDVDTTDGYDPGLGVIADFCRIRASGHPEA